MYIVKHNYILGSMFTNTRHNYIFRPSVLTIFRLYMRILSISYTKVCGEFTGCGVGWVRDLVCVGERGVDWGC